MVDVDALSQRRKVKTTAPIPSDPAATLVAAARVTPLSPPIDVAKVGQLADLYERIEGPAIEVFNEAMVTVQKAMQVIACDAENPFKWV
jgi:hypothetical protein